VLGSFFFFLAFRLDTARVLISLLSLGFDWPLTPWAPGECDFAVPPTTRNAVAGRRVALIGLARARPTASSVAVTLDAR